MKLSCKRREKGTPVFSLNTLTVNASTFIAKAISLGSGDSSPTLGGFASERKDPSVFASSQTGGH